MKRFNRNGAVLWRGASRLDGAPIIVVATGLASASANGKTGDLIQTWILRADIAPHDAIGRGLDASICGACPMRGDGHGGARACYVQVARAPLAVWGAATRGRYRDMRGEARAIAAVGAGRKVRLGAYGDPAAVPTYVWDAFVSRSIGHTGYTHQSAHPSFDPAILRHVMISADTDADVARADALGARAFIVRPHDAPRPAGTMQCPAAAEAGKRLDCASCLACDGADGHVRRHVSIAAHGAGAKHVGGAGELLTITA